MLRLVFQRTVWRTARCTLRRAAPLFAVLPLPTLLRLPACLALVFAAHASGATRLAAADTVLAAARPAATIDGARGGTIDAAPDSAAARARDSVLAKSRDSIAIPDPTWRWPANPRTLHCRDPLESLAQCWRLSPQNPQASRPTPPSYWALRETGFPGLRATALNLHTLEPARVDPFFQAGLAASPYGTGGHVPLEHYEAHEARGVNTEVWAPVQPLDTPVTDLHWMRGATLMNQFGLKLHRMVGNRAYVAFDYFSNGAERQYYDYTFQVHQPYLSAGRDSLSMVIQDTSHAIATRQIRPRLGFWLDQKTVVEVWADWFSNSSSMANPTNLPRNDSTQLLYPASFSSAAYGGLLARSTENHLTKLTFRHAGWERALSPRGDSARSENAAGLVDIFDAEWTARALPGEPRLTARAENTFTDGAFWLRGTDGTGASAASTGSRGDRESVALDAHPALGFLGVDLRGEAARRARADGVVEILGTADADARLSLPGGFSLTGGAGYAREGAPEDNLFRWQPALGLYPNPDLAPRTQARYGAGAGWESKHLGIDAAWERHRFDDNWLPRILPQPDVCALLFDSLSYPGEAAACAGETLPDSLALALVNYREETRELLHVGGYLAAGNWRLTLRNTYLLGNAIRDPRLGFAAVNWQLPQNVLKGQLLWRRRVLDGKLGLQTRWDWEWFSPRHVFASDRDGTSRLMPLDEYLVLDFTSQMEIKSFLLYFRAMNLYHDRYATEPGVHPPGVNFRFGVDWRLRN